MPRANIFGATRGDEQDGGAHSVERGGGAAYLPQLGRLARESYSYFPSPVQLGAMYQTDPDSLHEVRGF